jgi:hypothetical protein
MKDHQLDPEMLVFSGSAPIPPTAIVGRLVVSVKAALRRAKTGRGLDRDYQPLKNTLLGKGEWELLEFPLPVCPVLTLPAELGGLVGFY